MSSVLAGEIAPGFRGSMREAGFGVRVREHRFLVRQLGVQAVLGPGDRKYDAGERHDTGGYPPQSKRGGGARCPASRSSGTGPPGS